MTTDAIFMKYAEALDLGADTRVSGDAVLLALRLAVQDAYAAGGALADDLAAIVASQAQASPDQRVAESAINQIGRLNEWLAKEEPALYASPAFDTARSVLIAIQRREDDLTNTYHDLQAAIGDVDGLRQQLAQMDADNVDLTRQLAQKADANTTLIMEIDRLTRQNVIAVDTFNSLAAERTNGAAAVDHVSNVTEAAGRSWFDDLDADTNDYRISLAHGRRKFREVPKPARLLLAQAVARHIGGGGLPKQADFDAHKPDWMPGGGGLAVTFGCNWSELLHISPATVAP